MDKLAKNVAARYLVKAADDRYDAASSLGTRIIEITARLQNVDFREFLSLWRSIGQNLIRLGSTTPDWDAENWEEESHLIFDSIRDELYSIHNMQKRTKMPENMALLDMKTVGKVMRRFQ